MHIAEGVLSAPVLLVGAVAAAGLTGVGVKKTDQDRIPVVAVMAAAFFIASLVHIPLGPASVHLILNGLMGALLGWACVPALLVGLGLQAVLFQFGGLTVLGVNTVIMAAPALGLGLVLRPVIQGRGVVAVAASFCVGMGGVIGAGCVAALALYASGEEFLSAAQLLVAAHLPVALLEGGVTAIVVGSLKRIRPEIFAATSESGV
ncbi:cobalt transporter CbiM [Desulfohalobium retbaense]|uniref:Cobalamin (Vitamin B12) biosynthesis CbiM protein n=1 Tax=Desulfohalobium retbaense (strain ATCC 49708 / DSM 5692 / JCM 16813 / HR100) TaxID=485915 RepID=C8X0V1_DESRD|nr:cobalt transporter CbiM [Desulfohalobium retbaense]ACV68048.1 cobalamin (vitamin B12) biosynthesis CbiM protein [Desulfohalobium retbaense DSM 5692]